MDVQQIRGWGVDKNVNDRPGYPLQQERHVDHDTMQGQSPWRETIPLKGASGALRKIALRMPTNKAGRWMLLMLADRVDALESKLTPRNLLMGAGVMGALMALTAFARSRMK